MHVYLLHQLNSVACEFQLRQNKLKSPLPSNLSANPSESNLLFCKLKESKSLYNERLHRRLSEE